MVDIFQDMAAVFDLARTRIGNKRDQVEDALREHKALSNLKKIDWN